MKITTFFNDKTDITIENYLKAYGVEDVKTYLSSRYLDDKKGYLNIDKFAHDMNEYIKDGSKPLYILIDCDVDGYMSGSIIYMYCKTMNKDLKIIPIFHDKYSKEHGLADVEVMEKLKEYAEDGKSTYLWISDAGSNDIEELKTLKDIGYEVYISDHHNVTVDSRDVCNALVNNQLKGNNITNTKLSGCGVTWKVLSYIDDLNGTKYANRLLSYVHLANVADSCSFLSAENQTFRYWGNKVIHENLEPFIEAFNSDGSLTNEGYAFGCVSRLNGLIRIGTLEDKQKLFRALVKGEDADEVVKLCDKLRNKQNYKLSKLIDELELVSDGKVMIFRLAETTPLTGLIANKLMSLYGKPIFVTHKKDDYCYAGSCRSPIPIRKTISENEFIFAEGHPQSFGICYNIVNEQNIIDDLEGYEFEEPICAVTSSISITKLSDSRYINKLCAFAEDNKNIWGKDIPKPRYHIGNIRLNSNDISVIGKNGSTITFTYKGMKFIKFFCGSKLKDSLCIGKSKDLMIEIIGEFRFNSFRGTISPQCIIDEIKADIRTKIPKNIEDIFKTNNLTSLANWVKI